MVSVSHTYHFYHEVAVLSYIILLSNPCAPAKIQLIFAEAPELFVHTSIVRFGRTSIAGCPLEGYQHIFSLKLDVGIGLDVRPPLPALLMLVLPMPAMSQSITSPHLSLLPIP